ncbi:hypothetical protein F5Y04DRAFT_248065 [Hypomontagnella monticulosa]|nr:hypothetical protein F5Y04DRAFT_248065 [Hypomontagnella monticulosa]
MDEIYTRRRRKTNVERIRCHQDMISITQATEGSGDNTLLSSEPCRSPRQSSDLPTTPSETKVTVRTTASAIWRYLRLVLVPWLVVLGIAIGHHAYYQQLDNEIVLSSDQRMWSFRNGSGLAFLVKTGLVIVVGVVAAQQIWATLRRNTVSVRGIDHMFEIMANPLAIFDRDILRHAKIVSVLAIISW